MTDRGKAGKNGRAAHRRPFGTLADGTVVEAITLANAGGMRVTLISYGAAIQAVWVPDRAGVLADVALGHDTLAPYVERPQFFGSTVGRVANRIAGGRFWLDGHCYRVPANDGDNALHGGPQGFDKANWTVESVSPDPEPTVRFAHVSPDGDMGFPGTLTIQATYRLTDDNALVIDYTAQTDQPTLVNMTNHAYWNLAGEGAAGGALDHTLTLLADAFLPTDEALIPTGERQPVLNTPFDFQVPTVINSRVRDGRSAPLQIGRGYDHCWITGEGVAASPRLVARLHHLPSGRMMAVETNQPGLQFYSGNFLDGSTVGKSGQLYRMGDAVVLEPQMFPDTPNQPAFGSLRLAPGETYRNHIRFRFGLEATDDEEAMSPS